MKIPLSRPFLGKEEEDAILEVMDSKFIAGGQIVKKFEDSLAAKFRRRYCLVVNSGTSALYLSLKVLGIKKVIFPSLTCPGVLHAILNAGSEPVFADVEADTHNIDLSNVTERQFDGSDGLIVTHAYGHSADMDILVHYIDKYHLVLIEDFSQAIGGYFKTNILGGIGKVSICSFYAAKNMTTGHGGAILTDDLEVYRKCLYARGDAPYDYVSNIIPLNYHMTDIQAAIGLIQLRKIDKMVEMRRQIAHKLTFLLNKLEVNTPIEKPGIIHTYYKYHLVLPESVIKREFISEMDKEGISTGILYDPPLNKTLLAKNKFGTDISMPVSEWLAPRVVSLPIFPEMADYEITKIYGAVEKILKNLK